VKALGASGGKDMTAVEIRQSARNLASTTCLEQMKSFKSYGIMADWERKWTTMDVDYEIKQLRLFQSLVERGLIHRKHKPVYWSPSSRTALAEAELEYRDDHKSTAAYVRFLIVGGSERTAGLQGVEGKLYILIWTTTPWTLPANKAIAINDELDYCVVKVGLDSMLVAKDLLGELASSAFAEREFKVAATIRGADLKHLKYINKLQGKGAEPQPIIHAEFVSPDSGTGLVHLAPGHGFDDYEVCKAIGVPVSAPINDEGFFTSEAYPDAPEKLTRSSSILHGGSKAVLSLLEDDVMFVHKYKHKYPYDWRTKQPVVIRATEQWFADVAAIKDDALASLQNVVFIPESGRNRLESFIKGRSEWCISRQRAWGVPIPSLYDESGRAVMTVESIEHIISMIQKRGIDAWFSDPPDDPAWVAPSLQGKYRRGTDTMDVWFDSGSSWTQTESDIGPSKAGNGSPRPADLYLEGTDQHRGWFQSSLLTFVARNWSKHVEPQSHGAMARIQAPYKRLITHGFTLDQQSKKMSKSLGNIISADQVMEGTLLPPLKIKGKSKGDGPTYDALGTDALRLWVAGSDFTRDVVIGQPVLQSVHTSLLKYRTIIKMLLGSIHKSARTSPLTVIDHIALIQLKDTLAEIQKHYENYEFYKATSSLNRWINIDLSAFYLEALKDRLYCGDGGGVLEPIFNGLLRMLSPITPLLVEEAWDHRPDWLKAET
jgi:isoleucyl-tRNA synthetase